MKKRFKLKDNLLRFRGFFKWLSPGMGIKRWIGLGSFGVILIVIGSGNLNTQEYWVVKALYAIVLICGIIILILGIKNLMRSLVAAFMPSRDAQLVDILYQRRQLGRGPKVVVVGGGTGLSVLLSGIKEYSSNISAIVTVADDGGSSGRLREQFDILPPGDIRNCLVALADAPALMRDLFQFRFGKGSDLSGHNFGNLFITVMTQLTGDFEKAIRETSKVLALKGQVIPSTLDNVVLVAHHKDGTVTEGENKIPRVHKAIQNVVLKPAYPAANPEAIRAIEEAEVIIFGPGSLYTSILPNLLIKDISEAVVASAAIKIYVCNIMTQPGETEGYRVSDHIHTFINHTHHRIFEYCIVNNVGIPREIMERYAQEGSYPVVNDVDNIKKMGYRVLEDNLVISENNLIRHNPEKLASIIFGFIEET
ncbi:MAG: YvcK family protein [Candidatus Omnitrophota bacterium]